MHQNDMYTLSVNRNLPPSFPSSFPSLSLFLSFYIKVAMSILTSYRCSELFSCNVLEDISRKNGRNYKLFYSLRRVFFFSIHLRMEKSKVEKVSSSQDNSIVN